MGVEIVKLKSNYLRTTLAIFLGISLCISTTACSDKSKDTTTSKTTAPASTVKSKGDGKIHIKYVGNSCFNITFADGTRLVTDPYGSLYSASFAPFPDLTADVVTITDNYVDHTKGLSEVKGSPKVIQPEQVVPTKV